jgi:hypothetical protein
LTLLQNAIEVRAEAKTPAFAQSRSDKTP